MESTGIIFLTNIVVNWGKKERKEIGVHGRRSKQQFM